MKIKAIIFDSGGVLHTNEIKYVYDDIKQTLKLSEEVFTKAYKKLILLLQLGKISEDEYWRMFARESGTKQQLPKISLFVREYIKRFKPNKGVLKLIKLLKNKGYKLAILSDTIVSHKEHNDKQGIYDDFDVRIFSNEVGLKKPDPRMYELVLRRLKVKPGESIFIDDVLDYVETANKLGIYGLLFKSLAKLKSDLEKFKVI